MLLCTFGDDEETRVDQDCLVEAYRQGWLSLSGVLAPDAALCRGALYESAFAAGDLPVYDWSLYPGGRLSPTTRTACGSGRSWACALAGRTRWRS